MTSLRRNLLLLIAFSATAADVRAASVTIGASKDNSIFQNVANRSAGGSAGIFSGTNAVGSPRRGLIAFDVAASVPAGATVNSVELTLHLGATGGGMPQSIGLHRLALDWGEGTAGNTTPTVRLSGNGFTAAPGDATWNANFLGSSLWTNPGATGDFAATASATTIISDSIEAQFTWLSTVALVSDVQSWLDSPITNFGWALINANEVDDATVRAFYSRSATVNAGGDPLDLSARPALMITFTIPEPTAAALVLSACAFLFVAGAQRQL